MLTPKFQRLPPVTVEFLRIVQGVEAVRLQCGGCKAVHVVPWADVGLADASPFPPSGITWRCSICGGTDIAATPEWPAKPKSESKAPIETAASPASRDAEADDLGAISPELRERLEAVMVHLRKVEG